MKPDVITEAVRRRLVSSCSWRVVSLLFESPGPDRRSDLPGLLKELDDEPLRRAARAAAPIGDGEFQALFGPGGAVSPREVKYLPAEDPGRVLADLKGFYEAFKYQPRNRETFDHFSTEAGFLGFLQLKCAFALAEGEQEPAQLVEKALEEFARSHFAPFAQAFSARLLQIPEHPYLDLARLIQRQSGRVGIT